MYKYYSSILFVVVLLLTQSCTKEPDLRTVLNPEIESLRLNQIQIIASHNSYRIRTYEPLLQFVQSIASSLPAEYDPAGWDYTHPPFEDQFELGVRGLEIDFFADPNGGLFANYNGLIFINENPASNVAELQEPGMKVLHIPDVDYRTHYHTFKQALQAVKEWSDAHPRHLPIFINLETKEDGLTNYVAISTFTFTMPFNQQLADDIDTEIKSVFGEELDKVITPDDVRGSYATLREAVLDQQWPTLGDARGKVVFIMEGGAVPHYTVNHPSLSDRACFTYANANSPEAAFLIHNNPKSNYNIIRQRVQEGFIVRTRSDSDTGEARTGDYSSMDAAFNAWAQIVSTDYYQPDPRGSIPGSGWTNFQVKFPEGELARINALSAPEKVGVGKIEE